MILATPPIEPMRIEFDFASPSLVPAATSQEARAVR